MAANKILAVDDSEMIRRLIADTLRPDGYEVLLAADGPEALETARAEAPDLILLDITLPGMDGHEVLSRLREDKATQSTPVVVLSASGDITSQLESLEFEGAVDYITKPFRPADLRETVRMALDPSGQSALDKRKGRKQAKLRTYKEIMERKTEG